MSPLRLPQFYKRKVCTIVSDAIVPLRLLSLAFWKSAELNDQRVFYHKARIPTECALGLFKVCCSLRVPLVRIDAHWKSVRLLST
jgi:hypothetical protein